MALLVMAYHVKVNKFLLVINKNNNNDLHFYQFKFANLKHINGVLLKQLEIVNGLH
jgi:hypothetical protein